MSSLLDYGINLDVVKPFGYIYQIIHIETQRCYIGMTTRDVETRILEHLSGQGSKTVLKDIVKFGISAFKFRILQYVYTNNLECIETQYIDQYNCIYPNGYNLRKNDPIEPNDDEIDYENIKIEAKFCYKRGIHNVFSVGEFTQSRAFQLLSNIKKFNKSTILLLKTKFKFRYYELRVDIHDSDDVYEKDGIYNIDLNYDIKNDCFETN